ncbi:MAG: DUF2178 domain-containing protein [Anaerolineales bacterium]|nr:DUF2178 domain-containing protein [Anaerolineales bacterium]
MDYKVYLWLKRLIFAAVLGGVGFGVWQHNVIPAILSIGLGIVGLSILRSGTNAVLVDERLEKIADKASRGAFFLSTIIFALVSLGFLVFNRQGMLFPQILGTLFGYVAIGMLTLYLLLYWIHSRQMGVEGEE